MQRDEVGPRLTVPIVDDVIDARESLLDLEPPEDIDSCFHFDPKKFQDEHEDIALDAYRLDEDELEEAVGGDGGGGGLGGEGDIGDDLDAGVDGPTALGQHFHLGPPDGAVEGVKLAIDVGYADVVEVDQGALMPIPRDELV